MLLGFCTNTYFVVEGPSMALGRKAEPQPILTQAVVSDGPWDEVAAMFKDGLTAADYKLVFREDSFEPISRIRRGRLYTSEGRQSTENWNMSRILHPGVADSGYRVKTFVPFNLLQAFPNWKGTSPIIALGSRQVHSFWRILFVEPMHTGDQLVTIKSASFMGTLPEVLGGKVDPAAENQLRQAADHLAGEALRSSPESVIDLARDVITIAFAGVLARMKSLPKVGMDLGDLSDSLAKAIEAAHPNTKRASLPHQMALSCSRIVQRLHSQRKPSEQARRGLLPPTGREAELAVLCAAAVMTDLELASWT